jgi:hypothetical protein
MKSDAVLARLKELGMNTTLRTLQRYEAAGLLPLAQRGWGPTGFGRYASYGPSAPAEFFASYCLVHRYLWKVRFEDVHAVRDTAIKMERRVWTRDELQGFIEKHDDKMAAVWYWLVNKAKVDENLSPDSRFGLTYVLQKDGSMRRMITGPNALSLIRFEIAVL